MTFIFRNRTIFWDIPKWNRGQTKWDGGSINFSLRISSIPKMKILSFSEIFKFQMDMWTGDHITYNV